MDVVIDGVTVSYTDEQLRELLRQRPELWAALSARLRAEDLALVDFGSRLTETQRALLGSSPIETWTPEQLVQRWKAAGRQDVAAELELALQAQGYVADVARPKREFWVALGDSEMTGIAPVAGLPAGYPPGNEQLGRLGLALKWEPLAEPVSDEPRINPAPGVGLAGLFAFYRQKRVGGQVGIVTASKLGVASDQWPPSSTSGLFGLVASRLSAALATGAVFRGFIMAEGMNDAAGIGGVAMTTRNTNFNAFFTALETAIPRIAGKPVLYMQIPPTTPSFIAQANVNTVRALQASWASATRIMVPADDGIAADWLTGSANVRVHRSVIGFDKQAQQFDTAGASI